MALKQRSVLESVYPNIGPTQINIPQIVPNKQIKIEQIQ